MKVEESDTGVVYIFTAEEAVAIMRYTNNPHAFTFYLAERHANSKNLSVVSQSASMDDNGCMRLVYGYGPKPSIHLMGDDQKEN